MDLVGPLHLKPIENINVDANVTEKRKSETKASKVNQANEDRKEKEEVDNPSFEAVTASAKDCVVLDHQIFRQYARVRDERRMDWKRLKPCSPYKYYNEVRVCVQALREVVGYSPNLSQECDM